MIVTSIKTFSAIRAANGRLRRLWSEAADETEAHEFCLHIGAGLEGEAQRPESAAPALRKRMTARPRGAFSGGSPALPSTRN